MHLLAFFFPIFGFGFVLYFLPAIIAFERSKRDAGAILVLNFFLAGRPSDGSLLWSGL
jgi:Superinfection immunity protein